VAPVVTEFLAANPKVSVSLLLSDNLANIVEEGIDLAVRIGRLQDSGLVARKLGEVRRVACASPAYLKRRGTPKTPADLADHSCLQFGSLSALPYWEFLESGKSRQVRVRGSFSATHGAPLIDAARNGLGIVLAVSYQLQDAVAAGELRVLLREFEPAPVPVQSIVPSGRLQPARVRAFAELLHARISAKDLARLSRRP
jgi:DNA-binding transcriptional LysR family regulator